MLARLSLLPAFAALVYGQGAPLGQTTSAPSVTIAGCGGCYVIADVAQVLFGSEVVTETATQVVSAGTGRNGTTVTTSFVQPLAPFSFDTSGLITGTSAAPAFAFPTGTVVTVNGATLTSPTAYNVFTAYTAFVLNQQGGSCQTITQASTLATASSYIVGTASTEIFDAENQFIAAVGLPSCTGLAAAITTTSNIVVSQTTVTSSTSGIFRPTPIAETSAAATTSGAAATSGVSAAASSGSSGSSSTSIVLMTPGGGANTTSIITGASSQLVIPSKISSAVLAALFVLPGLGALML